MKEEILAAGPAGAGGLFPHGVNKINIEITVETVFKVVILIEGPASERPAGEI